MKIVGVVKSEYQSIKKLKKLKKVSLQVMKRSSTTHGTSAASTREFMKHASIYPCTRVPKNCKYTELKLYFTVYNYVYVVYFVLFSSISSLHSHPELQDVCSRLVIYSYRHLLHYIAQYCNTGELTRVSFLE